MSLIKRLEESAHEISSVKGHETENNLISFDYCVFPGGNSDPTEPQFDLCFGGRRQFCGGSYVDFGKYLPFVKSFNPLRSFSTFPEATAIPNS